MSDEVPGNEPPQNLPPQNEPPRQEPFPPMSPPPKGAPPTFQSNYPRGPQSILDHVRPPGVYWDTFSTSVSMIFSKWSVYVMVSLVMFLCVMIAYSPLLFLGGAAGFMAGLNRTTVAPISPLITLGPTLLGQVCNAFLILCMISVGVRHAQGAEPEVGDFFIPFRKFGKSAMAALLAAIPNVVASVITVLVQLVLPKNSSGQLLAAGVSLILGLMAYLCAYGTLILAGTAAVFTDMSPIDCAKKAFSTLGYNSIVFGLLFFIASILSAVGVFLCCFGVLITLPIPTNVVALHYIYCFQNNPDTSTELKF